MKTHTAHPQGSRWRWLGLCSVLLLAACASPLSLASPPPCAWVV